MTEKPAYEELGKKIQASKMAESERKQAEEALKYSQLQLDTIFNNLNSSIYVTDMKSHEVLFMNDHMKDLFGIDLTGSLCWESFHEDLKGPCDFCTNDKLTDADGNPVFPKLFLTKSRSLS